MRGSPFFDGVTQVPMAYAGRQTAFPIFYYDGSATTAVFAARLGGLRALLPDPRFVPARLAPGVGALAISAFEYRDSDLGPYNELGIAVLLAGPGEGPNAPGRAMLRGMRRRQLHAFVRHLPVTTEAALVGGRHFYGYPKFVAGIEFGERGGRRTCRLSEGDEEILTLTAEPLRAGPGDEQQMFTHLWMDRQPQGAEFKLNGLTQARSLRPGAARVELTARHPIARELAGVLLSPASLYCEQLPSFEAILYPPEHLTPVVLERLAEAQRRAETAAVADPAKAANGAAAAPTRA